MKNTLGVLVALAMFASLAGQTHKNQSRTAAVSASTAARPDLNPVLADLERVAAATQSDISAIRTEKWGRKRGFIGKNSPAQEAGHTALSLQRNLDGALPRLINDVRTSRGSVSSAFKLYDDLSVACQALDSLSSAAETYGKKEEYTPLANDLSAMIRIRRSLSSYIEAKAGEMENKSSVANASSDVPRAPRSSPGMTTPKKTRTVVNNSPEAGQPSSAQPAGTPSPRKIVIDDNVPEEKPAKKKAAQYSNL